MTIKFITCLLYTSIPGVPADFGIGEQGEGISMKEYIKNRVHELYWNDNINCARTAIICLSELFETAVELQTIWSAVGLHGAGGYRATMPASPPPPCNPHIPAENTTPRLSAGPHINPPHTDRSICPSSLFPENSPKNTADSTPETPSGPHIAHTSS